MVQNPIGEEGSLVLEEAEKLKLRVLEFKGLKKEGRETDAIEGEERERKDLIGCDKRRDIC